MVEFLDQNSQANIGVTGTHEPETGDRAFVPKDTQPLLDATKHQKLWTLVACGVVVVVNML